MCAAASEDSSPEVWAYYWKDTAEQREKEDEVFILRSLTLLGQLQAYRNPHQWMMLRGPTSYDWGESPLR